MDDFGSRKKIKMYKKSYVWIGSLRIKLSRMIYMNDLHFSPTLRIRIGHGRMNPG
jgi:hypothetical protein